MNFPTAADLRTRPRAKARRILIRAIELALDNGELGGFCPTEKQWNDWRGKDPYVDEATTEERMGYLPYNVNL